MFKVLAKIVCLAFISFTTLEVCACEKYDLPSTTLAGTVTIEMFYGPPGYGESPATDLKERAVLLRLAKPLCTVASNDSAAEQNQVKVMLVPMDNLSLEPLRGKR